MVNVAGKASVHIGATLLDKAICRRESFGTVIFQFCQYQSWPEPKTVLYLLKS